MNFKLNFTDLTIIETEGKYDEIEEIFNKEVHDKHEWVISTNLTLDNEAGVGVFEIDFYFDKKVVITSYSPSIGDVYYNPDIMCLSEWSQGNGWLRPEPVSDLIKGDIGFWKHFWETGIIISEFFEKRHGSIDEF